MAPKYIPGFAQEAQQIWCLYNLLRNFGIDESNTGIGIQCPEGKNCRNTKQRRMHPELRVVCVVLNRPGLASCFLSVGETTKSEKKMAEVWKEFQSAMKSLAQSGALEELFESFLTDEVADKTADHLVEMGYLQRE